MRIAYLILAHQHPALLARLIRRLDASGGLIAVHFDLNAGDAPPAQLKKLLGDIADRVLWAKRTRVAWGEWSIPEATLNGLDAIAQSGERVDYVHLLSGADYPIRPLSEFMSLLERTRGIEYIEAVDISRQRWVRIGPEHERYLYRHHLNWRSHPWLAQRYWRLQQALRLKRRLPAGLKPHLGSQWWTLTWPTCEMIRATGRDPAIRRFFRSVAIPDEMFFQTIVAARVPRHRIATGCLTFSQFTDYGVPVVYYDDHADYLQRLPFFFARKISAHATGLRDALDRANDTPAAAGLPALNPARIAIKPVEYETERQQRRQPIKAVRTIGHVPDPIIGDLAVARPFVAVVGASRGELAFLQRLLASAAGIACHGALFAPDGIEFLGGLERHAGFHLTDTFLRDHCRTSFLAEVLAQSGRVPGGLTLPWGADGGMLPLLPRIIAARLLIVRGNALTAFIEHRNIATSPGSHVAPSEFAGFLTTLERFYESLPKPAEPALSARIDLTSPDWLDRLNDFTAAIAGEAGSVSASTITPELAAFAARQITDPARFIANAEALIETCIPAHQRRGHISALGRAEAPIARAEAAASRPGRPPAGPATSVIELGARRISAAE